QNSYRHRCTARRRVAHRRETTAHSAQPGYTSAAPTQPSPLAQTRPRTASDTSTSSSTTSDASHASHPSQDGIAWDYPLQRQQSFSRPRPPRATEDGVTEPRKAVTSVYVDQAGRTSSAEGSRSPSSLYSWSNGGA
ncbi:hypothetical protein K458DRAFT_346592, partial [Lentithecium fluviatile CBS 122367]